MILLNGFLPVIFDVFGIALICALCSIFFEDYEQEETKRIKSATITPKGHAPAKGAGKRGNIFSIKLYLQPLQLVKKRLAIERRR